MEEDEGSEDENSFEFYKEKFRQLCQRIVSNPHSGPRKKIFSGPAKAKVRRSIILRALTKNMISSTPMPKHGLRESAFTPDSSEPVSAIEDFLPECSNGPQDIVQPQSVVAISSDDNEETQEGNGSMRKIISELQKTKRTSDGMHNIISFLRTNQEIQTSKNIEKSNGGDVVDNCSINTDVLHTAAKSIQTSNSSGTHFYGRKLSRNLFGQTKTARETQTGSSLIRKFSDNHHASTSSLDSSDYLRYLDKKRFSNVKPYRASSDLEPDLLPTVPTLVRKSPKKMKVYSKKRTKHDQTSLSIPKGANVRTGCSSRTAKIASAFTQTVTAETNEEDRFLIPDRQTKVGGCLNEKCQLPQNVNHLNPEVAMEDTSGFNSYEHKNYENDGPANAPVKSKLGNNNKRFLTVVLTDCMVAYGGNNIKNKLNEGTSDEIASNVTKSKETAQSINKCYEFLCSEQTDTQNAREEKVDNSNKLPFTQTANVVTPTKNQVSESVSDDINAAHPKNNKLANTTRTRNSRKNTQHLQISSNQVVAGDSSRMILRNFTSFNSISETKEAHTKQESELLELTEGKRISKSSLKTKQSVQTGRKRIRCSSSQRSISTTRETLRKKTNSAEDNAETRVSEGVSSQNIEKTAGFTREEGSMQTTRRKNRCRRIYSEENEEALDPVECDEAHLSENIEDTEAIVDQHDQVPKDDMLPASKNLRQSRIRTIQEENEQSAAHVVLRRSPKRKKVRQLNEQEDITETSDVKNRDIKVPGRTKGRKTNRGRVSSEESDVHEPEVSVRKSTRVRRPAVRPTVCVVVCTTRKAFNSWALSSDEKLATAKEGLKKQHTKTSSYTLPTITEEATDGVVKSSSNKKTVNRKTDSEMNDDVGVDDLSGLEKSPKKRKLHPGTDCNLETTLPTIPEVSTDDVGIGTVPVLLENNVRKSNKKRSSRQRKKDQRTGYESEINVPFESVPAMSGVHCAYISQYVNVAGVLMIKPGAMKSKQLIKHQNLVFYVIQGDAQFEVNNSRFDLSQGRMFDVSKGHDYSITNMSNDDLILVYGQSLLS